MDAPLVAREAVLPEPAAPERDERVRLAAEVALAALGMGVLGRALMDAPTGVGAPLWVGALLLTLLDLAQRNGVRMRGEGRWMALPALLFSAALAWRGAEALAVLNVFAVLVALALLVHRGREGRLREAGVPEYLWAGIWTGLRVAGGAALLVFGEVRWSALPGVGRMAGAGAVLRGLLLATPLLVVFAALFSSADPVFGELLGRLAAFDNEAVFEFVLGTVLWGVLAAGLLRGALHGGRSPAEVVGAGAVPRWRVGGVEAAVVLGSLDALFLAFVLVQLRYLFGGAALVETTVAMTYAEYARRGFFELVAVAALALPVLVALDAGLARAGERQRRLFRALAAALLLLLGVVIVSAAQRMRLYTDGYGLTEQRLYASAFMAWLTMVFAWFAATVLRGRSERFAWGALLAGFATLGALNLMNPGEVIARNNLAHARTTGRLDVHYLDLLGPDAVPALLAALPALRPAERCQLADRLARRAESLPDDGWTNWNRGRTRAAGSLRAQEARLRALACPVPAPRTSHQGAGGGAGSERPLRQAEQVHRHPDAPVQ